MPTYSRDFLLYYYNYFTNLYLGGINKLLYSCSKPISFTKLKCKVLKEYLKNKYIKKAYTYFS